MAVFTKTMATQMTMIDQVPFLLAVLMLTDAIQPITMEPRARLICFQEVWPPGCGRCCAWLAAGSLPAAGSCLCVRTPIFKSLLSIAFD